MEKRLKDVEKTEYTTEKDREGKTSSSSRITIFTLIALLLLFAVHIIFPELLGDRLRENPAGVHFRVLLLFQVLFCIAAIFSYFRKSYLEFLAAFPMNIKVKAVFTFGVAIALPLVFFFSRKFFLNMVVHWKDFILQLVLDMLIMGAFFALMLLLFTLKRVLMRNLCLILTLLVCAEGYWLVMQVGDGHFQFSAIEFVGLSVVAVALTTLFLHLTDFVEKRINRKAEELKIGSKDLLLITRNIACQGVAFCAIAGAFPVEDPSSLPYKELGLALIVLVMSLFSRGLSNSDENEKKVLKAKRELEAYPEWLEKVIKDYQNGE